MAGRAFVLLLIALSAESGPSDTAQFDEQAVKAAALINVARFVEWPAPVTPGAPFVIAVAGSDSVVASVGQSVRGRRLHDRDVLVLRQADDGPCGCQVLFVSGEEDGRSAALLGFVRADPVLTVGETPGFLRAGGMVRLYREGDRLRLQIRKGRSPSSLQISSRLLQLSAGQ